MKRRHLWMVAVSLIIAICMCFGLSACSSCNGDDGGDKHTTHNWSETYTPDGATGHYQTCDGCDELKRADHDFDSDTDTTCDTCGYTRTIETPVSHTHNYGNWTVDPDDNTKHIGTCTSTVGDCDAPTVKEEHDFSEGDCICGAEDPDPDTHKHKYTYTDNNDGTHSAVCNGTGDCDAPTIDRVAHDFSKGDCVCGAKKPVTPVVHEHDYEWYDNEDGETHTGICFNDDGECDAPEIEEPHHFVDGFCDKCDAEDLGDTPIIHEHDYIWEDNGDGTHDGFCIGYGECDEEEIIGEAHHFVDGVCDKCEAVEEIPLPAGEKLAGVIIADYAEENGWENANKYSVISIKDGDAVIAEIKAYGTTNTGKYYTSGNNWRIYASESPELEIEAKDGYEIASVKFIYTGSNSYAIIADADNTDTQFPSGQRIDDPVGKVFTAVNANVQITAIEITYKVLGEPLDTPVVTVDDNGVATWNKVANAGGYAYAITKDEVTGDTVTVDKDGTRSVTLKNGETIEVWATADSKYFADSEKASATFTQIPLGEIEITIDGYGIAHWECENASSFVYKIGENGEEQTTTEHQITAALADGETIYVKAIGTGLYISHTEFTSKTYSAPKEAENLSAPVVTVAMDGTASWKKIPGASGYIVKVNGVEQEKQTALTYSLSHSDTIEVKSVGDGGIVYNDSDYTTAITYKKAPDALEAPEIVAIDFEGTKKGVVIVTFEIIDNATAYAYKIGSGNEVVLTATDLSEAEEEGFLTFEVALADGATISVRSIGNKDTFVVETAGDYSGYYADSEFPAEAETFTVDDGSTTPYTATTIIPVINYFGIAYDDTAAIAKTKPLYIEGVISTHDFYLRFVTVTVAEDENTVEIFRATLDSSLVSLLTDLDNDEIKYYTVTAFGVPVIKDGAYRLTESQLVDLDLTEDGAKAVKADAIKDNSKVLRDAKSAFEAIKPSRLNLDGYYELPEDWFTVPADTDKVTNGQLTVTFEITDDKDLDIVGGADIMVDPLPDADTTVTVTVKFTYSFDYDDGYLYTDTITAEDTTFSFELLVPSINTQPDPIGVPNDVTIDRVTGVASWGIVNGAVKYQVKVNGVEKEPQTERTYPLTNNGDTIEVRAIGDGVNFVEEGEYCEAKVFEKLYVDEYIFNSANMGASSTGTNDAGLNTLNGLLETYSQNKNYNTTLVFEFTGTGNGTRPNLNSGGYVQFLTGNGFTISANGLMSKIEISHSEGNTNKPSVDTGSITTSNGVGTWTGSAAEVSFSHSGSQWKITSIKITYAELTDGSKAQAAKDALTPLKESYTADFTVDAIGKFDLPIKWSSSDESCIKFSETPENDKYTATVTRKLVDTEVTVTATIKCGEATRTQTFTITVPKVDPVAIKSAPIVTVDENGKATWADVEEASKYAVKYVYQLKGADDSSDFTDEDEATDATGREVTLTAYGQRIRVKAVGTDGYLIESGWSKVATYNDPNAHVHSYTYTDNGDGTHNGVCDCGEDEIVSEAHTFIDGACYDCGAVEAAKAWKLVTDISQLSVGSQIVITNEASTRAISTTQGGNNRAEATVTKNADGTLTINDSVCVLQLVEGTVSGSYGLQITVAGSGTDNAVGNYLYAADSSKNYLRSTATLDANASCSISVTPAGVATMKFQGSNTRNLIQYNSSNKMFSCYNSNQGAISIYVFA